MCLMYPVKASESSLLTIKQELLLRTAEIALRRNEVTKNVAFVDRQVLLGTSDAICIMCSAAQG